MKLVAMTRMLLAGAVALLATPAAIAAEATKAPAAEGSTLSQLRVVRDQFTGELRAPDAAELKAMIEAENAENAAKSQRAAKSGLPALRPEMVLKRHKNGMQSMQLSPEYLVNLHGTRDASGQLVTSHDRLGDSHAAPAAAPTE